jgi:hypothetical protein
MFAAFELMTLLYIRPPCSVAGGRPDGIVNGASAYGGQVPQGRHISP